MPITHTDTNIPDLKINKFSSLAEFQAAQAQSLIGNDEISFIDELIQPDWNQSTSSAPDYIKNKPSIPEIPSQTGHAGQFLTTSGTAMSWATVSGGSSSLADLTDTSIGTPINGQVLTYDSNTAKWINAAAPTGTLPSQTGMSGRFLTTNGTNASWSSIPYDFTFSTLSVSSNTATFNALGNTRAAAQVTVSGNLSLTLNIYNLSDNYIWVFNTSSSSINVVIAAVNSSSGAINTSNIHVSGGSITVPANGLTEIGVICNSTKVFITSREY